MSYGVTPQLIEAFGDIIFRWSLNVQRRRGDPVRLLQMGQVDAQREDAGLTDAQIADRIGLTVEQTRYIRVVMERRRYRRDQYRKLFDLGVSRRYRQERDARAGEREMRPEALHLREAMAFHPDQVRKFAENGWWTGETLDRWLADRARETPDKTAVVMSGGKLPYSQLHDTALRLAGSLAGLGLGRGDVISVQLPNVPEFFFVYLAACALGCVTTTLHVPYRRAEIETLLRHSRARAVVSPVRIGDFPAAETFVQLRGEITTLEHVLTVGGAVEGALPLARLFETGSRPVDYRGPVGADPYLLLYTSGTSASPKGVPVSYQNFLSNARLGVSEHQIGPDDVMLSAAPFTHLFGLYSVHLALATGAASVLLPAFTPQELAAMVEEHQATVLFAAPAHLAACLGSGAFKQRDLSSLKLMIVAGSACPPALINDFLSLAANCRATQLWGMTEIQAGTYTRPGDPDEVPAHTAGRPAPGNEVRVASMEGDELPPGQEGELQIRGCSVFPGYFDNPDANAQAFVPGGWFRTGDLAVIDGSGNVKLTGRVKDVINRGGIKFNPQDVEDLLNQHPKIQQAAMAPVPDPVLGERACCFAVPAAGQAVTLEEICDYLLQFGIAKFKLPERLELIPAMPLTPTRKVIKSRLQATV